MELTINASGSDIEKALILKKPNNPLIQETTIKRISCISAKGAAILLALGMTFGLFYPMVAVFTCDGEYKAGLTKNAKVNSIGSAIIAVMIVGGWGLCRGAVYYRLGHF